jgi:hypothetical protein
MKKRDRRKRQTITAQAASKLVSTETSKELVRPLRLSDSPDAICARHAFTGCVVGCVMYGCIVLIRSGSTTSDDAYQIKMTLYWAQNAMPFVGAIVGSLTGLFFVFLRWLNR